MAWGSTRTKHAGPKRGRGHWGRKAAAKAASKRCRRREDKLAATWDDATAFVREATRQVLSRSEW
jgi:hypothetical protein